MAEKLDRFRRMSGGPNPNRRITVLEKAMEETLLDVETLETAVGAPLAEGDDYIGGIDTGIMFNDGGTFATDTNLTWDGDKINFLGNGSTSGLNKGLNFNSSAFGITNYFNLGIITVANGHLNLQTNRGLTISESYSNDTDAYLDIRGTSDRVAAVFNLSNGQTADAFQINSFGNTGGDLFRVKSTGGVRINAGGSGYIEFDVFAGSPIIKAASSNILFESTNDNVTISGGNVIALKQGGTNRWMINSSAIRPNVTNTYDIGESSYLLRKIYSTDGYFAGATTIGDGVGTNGQVILDPTKDSLTAPSWVFNAYTSASANDTHYMVDFQSNSSSVLKISTNSVYFARSLRGSASTTGTFARANPSSLWTLTNTIGDALTLNGRVTHTNNVSTNVAYTINLANGQTENAVEVYNYTGNIINYTDYRGHGYFGGEASYASNTERQLQIVRPASVGNANQAETIFLGIGQGNQYSSGYGVIGLVNGLGTAFQLFEIRSHASTPSIRAMVDFGILNNKAITSSSTDVGATVGLLKFDSANRLDVGPRYSRGYSTRFWIGDNTVDYTWNVHDGSVELMRLTGGGNLGIGTTSIDASAILELQSTSKGFAPPVMTGAQVEAIPSPKESLMVYATDAGSGDITGKGWWGYNGTNWIQLG